MRHSLTAAARKTVALLFLASTVALTAAGQEEKADPLARRYNLDASPTLYPQKTPAEAMKSVVKAMDARRTDYLLAHLTDPTFVDKRIAEYKQRFTEGSDASKTLLAFNRLIAETEQHFRADPPLVKELRLFAKEGEWEEKDDVAIGTAKAAPARKVFLRKVGDRYFLENRQQ
jgi:hypothetical protein